mmetsp:Transcript_56157/g.111482  ORF Transcript_56157/g.111482 Transcript_56157/m.111482 type:complete len:210 (-) Transcript_56157:464-1093(-)
MLSEEGHQGLKEDVRPFTDKPNLLEVVDKSGLIDSLLAHRALRVLTPPRAVGDTLSLAATVSRPVEARSARRTHRDTRARCRQLTPVAEECSELERLNERRRRTCARCHRVSLHVQILAVRTLANLLCSTSRPAIGLSTGVSTMKTSIGRWNRTRGRRQRSMRVHLPEGYTKAAVGVRGLGDQSQRRGTRRRGQRLKRLECRPQPTFYT